MGIERLGALLSAARLKKRLGTVGKEAECWGRSSWAPMRSY